MLCNILCCWYIQSNCLTSDTLCGLRTTSSTDCQPPKTPPDRAYGIANIQNLPFLQTITPQHLLLIKCHATLKNKKYIKFSIYFKQTKTFFLSYLLNKNTNVQQGYFFLKFTWVFTYWSQQCRRHLIITMHLWIQRKPIVLPKNFKKVF